MKNTRLRPKSQREANQMPPRLTNAIRIVWMIVGAVVVVALFLLAYSMLGYNESPKRAKGATKKERLLPNSNITITTLTEGYNLPPADDWTIPLESLPKVARRVEPTDQRPFYRAIRKAEGWRGVDVPGPDGERGEYQVTPIWWADCNRITGRKLPFVAKHYLNRKLIERRMRAYWKNYDANTGEEKARMHNGGPDGMGKQATLTYWRRVEEEWD